MSSTTFSKGQIGKAIFLALVLALLALFTLVLPAETGYDPLGTGRALGLLGLSGVEESAIHEQHGDLVQHKTSFVLEPFESIEYKYRLPKDGSLTFTWVADADLVYDFHAEPDGAEPGFAESFEQGRATTKSGTFVAHFDGIHGWFWENRKATPVTLQLFTSGFLTETHEFRGGTELTGDASQP